MTLRTLSEDPFPYIKLLDTLLNPPPALPILNLCKSTGFALVEPGEVVQHISFTSSKKNNFWTDNQPRNTQSLGYTNNKQVKINQTRTWMIRDGKDRRGLHTTTFAETDWPQKHFYYWITFAMGDGRVPEPKRTRVAHVLVVTAKGCYNHQVESWLTRLIIISTAKSLMVVFLILK